MRDLLVLDQYNFWKTKLWIYSKINNKILDVNLKNITGVNESSLNYDIIKNKGNNIKKELKNKLHRAKNIYIQLYASLFVLCINATRRKKIEVSGDYQKFIN